LYFSRELPGISIHACHQFYILGLYYVIGRVKYFRNGSSNISIQNLKMLSSSLTFPNDIFSYILSKLDWRDIINLSMVHRGGFPFHSGFLSNDHIKRLIYDTASNLIPKNMSNFKIVYGSLVDGRYISNMIKYNEETIKLIGNLFNDIPGTANCLSISFNVGSHNYDVHFINERGESIPQDEIIQNVHHFSDREYM
jgi:hypothetical protein